MNKFREFLSKPAVTAVLFALALLLLGSSAVGGARAALNITSEYYNSQVEVLDIGLAIVEQQEDGSMKAVAGSGALMGSESEFGTEIASDGKLYAGKLYPELLAVKNTADINEYVRVMVFKYWVDENGVKFPEMDSDWIDLKFVTGSGWTIDTDTGSGTEERTILYYDSMLTPGATSSPFLDGIVISPEATRVVERVDVNGNTSIYKWSYVYNGKQFCIEVIADSVQDHNSEQAKISAWGVNK